MTDNQDDDVLPFFVYGTLRRDHANYHLLRGRVVEEYSAYVEGFHLFSLGDVPMAIHTKDAPYTLSEPYPTVYGELIYPQPYRYTYILELLDRLEGYQPDDLHHSYYWRTRQTVTLHTGESLTAWFYQGNPRYLAVEHYPIPSGDWTTQERILDYSR